MARVNRGRLAEITSLVCDKGLRLIKQEKPWVQVSSAPWDDTAIGSTGMDGLPWRRSIQDAGRWMQAGCTCTLSNDVLQGSSLYPFVDDWMVNGTSALWCPVSVPIKWKSWDGHDRISSTR